MGGGKMFDDYENEDDDSMESEEGPSHLQQLRQIFYEAKIDIADEDCDKNYDTILTLESGIKLCFDEEEKLVKIEND